METISASLRDRLTEIQRTACAGGSKRYFYSAPEIEHLLTRDCIAHCLAQLPVLKTATPHDIRRYSSIIRESSMLIFAALLLDGNEANILDFLFRRDTDKRLPYTADSLEYLPSLVRTHFVQRQWQVKPEILGGDEIHRQVHPDAVIPITAEIKAGAGGFGTVWKTTIYPTCQLLVPQDTARGVTVARKQLEEGLTGANERAVLRLVRSLKHPNIVEFLGSYAYHGVCNLLFTFADMNLREFLLAETRPPMEIRSVYAAIHGLGDALDQIHNFIFHDDNGQPSVGMVGYHHDLRPPNILVHRGTFVIADFGLSRLRPNDADSKTKLHGGDDDYLGPESFDYENWTNGSVGRPLDVWALGCILAELATFIGGYRVATFRDLRKATHGTVIRSTNYAFHLDGKVHPEVVRQLDQLAQEPRDPQLCGLIQVTRDMLNPNPFLRPKMSEIAPRLKLLAIESGFEAIYRWFTGRNASRTRDLGPDVFAHLEHIRLGAWHDAFYSLHQVIRLERATAVFATVTKLCDVIGQNPVLLDQDANTPATAALLAPSVVAEIDALCEALPEEAQKRVLDLWSRRVCDIDDFQVLQAIRLASKPERYRFVGIAAAMKQMSVAISKSIKLGERSRCMDSSAIEVDERRPTVPASIACDASRLMGYLAMDEGNTKQRVLVEWKAYEAEWKHHAAAQHQVMDNLANLLDPDVTPRLGVTKYRIPNCLGYFHDPGNFRFGFVYALPESVPVGVGDRPDTMAYTLNSIIRMAAESEASGGSMPMPDLGDVFLLAKDLAACLLAVHQVGWLHKNLSSHHVLVFSPSLDATGQCIASAVLAGFNDSRPEVSGFTLGPTQEFVHYQHPSYVRGTSFRRTFDYFGLGVVLLELGLWVAISELRADHRELITPEEFRLKLLGSYVPQLGAKMGALYRDAVLFCLDAENFAAQETLNHEDVAGMHSLFQEKVVEPLSRCFA